MPEEEVIPALSGVLETSLYVDDVGRVSEDEIKAAIHGLLSREKLVAEGSAAAAFAAVATGKIRMDGAAVAVITGGNIDLQTLSRAALSERGRVC